MDSAAAHRPTRVAQQDTPHVEPLLRLAHRLLGGIGDASRCVSDVLNAANGRPKSTLRREVAREASRRLVAHSAARGLTEPRLLPRFDAQGNHLAPIASWPVLTQPSSGTEMARACVERLPVLYRVMFTLHDVEGFSLEEISEILSIDSNRAQILRRESRQALRSLMAERFEEGSRDDFH